MREEFVITQIIFFCEPECNQLKDWFWKINFEKSESYCNRCVSLCSEEEYFQAFNYQKIRTKGRGFVCVLINQRIQLTIYNSIKIYATKCTIHTKEESYSVTFQFSKLFHKYLDKENFKKNWVLWGKLLHAIELRNFGSCLGIFRYVFR